MNHRVVVELALVAQRAEQEALPHRRLREHHQSLVGIAREDHFVKARLRALQVTYHHAAPVPPYARHPAAQMDAIAEVRGHPAIEVLGAWFQVTIGVPLSISKKSR